MDMLSCRASLSTRGFFAEVRATWWALSNSGCCSWAEDAETVWREVVASEARPNSRDTAIVAKVPWSLKKWSMCVLLLEHEIKAHAQMTLGFEADKA